MKLNKEIEEELRTIGADVLLKIDRSHCFSVPSLYFNEFPDKIIRNIDLQPSSILSGMRSQNPFSVPDNYFEGLAENITQNIVDRVPAKVVPMHAPKNRKFKSYLVAASVALLLGIAGIYIWQANSFNNLPDENFSAVGLEGVPEESLTNYLKETNPLPDLTDNQDILFLSHSFTTETNLEGLLHEMPEEDLIYYTNEFL